MNAITERILQCTDSVYREFCIKLTPSVSPGRILGVRVPVLRKIAKEASPVQSRAFMACLPHDYYEENNVHGYLIAGMKNYDECINALDKFLPYVDNWATCDTCSPKILKKNPANTAENAFRWIDSGKVYTMRFGIKILMDFFQEELFETKFSDKVAEIKSGEYYVNMMAAWYFATLLYKQWDYAAAYLENKKLDKNVHNKTIRKAVESYRITAGQKEYLRTLVL